MSSAYPTVTGTVFHATSADSRVQLCDHKCSSDDVSCPRSVRQERLNTVFSSCRTVPGNDVVLRACTHDGSILGQTGFCSIDGCSVVA